MDTDEQGRQAKRRRRGGERVRVTRACDFCKTKKLRCTGIQPCTSCARVEQPCTFKSEYNRGKAYRPVTSNASFGNGDDIDPIVGIGGNRRSGSNGNLQLQEGNHPIPEPLRQGEGRSCGIPDGIPDQRPNIPSDAGTSGVTVVECPSSPGAVEQAGRSSLNSPEPPNTDLEGHYVGPASGVSFLSRALKKLRKTSHTGSFSTAHPLIFNFADAPTPPFDPCFLILPSKEEAKDLIRHYFEFASPTHRYLHQPTINIWCDEFYHSIKHPGPSEVGLHEKRAIILALLAVSKQFSQRISDGEVTPQENIDSAIFFAASEHQLSREAGGIRLTSIQARLIQCFLLLSQSRVNSAWGLFGTVANLALAIGLHRRKKRDGAGAADLIEHEFRKRAFWSAYTLDNYLSIGLGRPRSFHEQDIDQELPLCVDDWQITPLRILPRQDTEQSLTQASIWHAKLLKIVGGISRDLYGLKRPPPHKLEQSLVMYDNRLIQWREEVAFFLDTVNPDILLPLFRRQYTVLRLAHAHAVIMLHRQALLTKTTTSDCVQDIPYGARRCLEAASIIIKTLGKLLKKQQMYTAYWFSHYYIFSALVALYLYVVQSRQKPGHIWQPYLDLAQQGLNDLATCAADGSYAQRYVVVLTELQHEATKVMEGNSQMGIAMQGVLQETMPGQPSLPSGIAQMDPITSAQPPHGHLADSDIVSQDPLLAPTGNRIHDSQHGAFSGPHFMQEAVDDALHVGNLGTYDDYSTLETEGLADLAFIFAAEDTSHLFSAIDTIS